MTRTVDLHPWRYVQPPQVFRRLRGLTPATGWYAVYAWRGDDGVVQLYWEPVACWAIETQSEAGADEPGDDAVVPVVRVDGGPSLAPATEAEAPLALHTEAERQDETVLSQLRDDARKALDRKDAERATDQREFDEVRVFVAARPDPAAFAARMRAGATSLHHAWLAITLAAGDADRAVVLAQRALYDLHDVHWRRTRQAAPAS